MNGFEPTLFNVLRQRKGPMTIGWAGNQRDPVKGFYEILEPACRGRFNLVAAGGDLPHGKMNKFYNGLDVIAVTSRHEGGPLPLIEAMAAGCFPVSTDVGIVPELVRSGENGLIVAEATAQGFRAAFQWCEENIDFVRKAGLNNAARMANERSWSAMSPRFKELFLDVLKFAQSPKFRNDDVSWDTPFERFQEFCHVFRDFGLTQVHGVTLKGRVCTFTNYGSQPAEYDGVPSISTIPNTLIRQLSEPFAFEERTDLISFLATSPDEIALHGLYHTDHSTMVEDELRSEIGSGLRKLEELFPNKLVRYFVAPFNRTSRALYDVCHEFDLEVLASTGVHLEQHIGDVVIRPYTWYRYHHHRFYPESTCRYYPTTVGSLREAFSRNRQILQGHDG